MKSHIQFLTTPTADTPGTALLLHFDNKRYLFGNIHEGLQRASLQFGGKFMKARDVFVTGKTEWATTGGLLGMVLTLSDSAKAATESKAQQSSLKFARAKARYEENKRLGHRTGPPPTEPVVIDDRTLRIHGGPNITHTFATARAFVFRNGMPLEIREYDNINQGNGEGDDIQPTWTDKHVKVWAMPLMPTRAETSESNTKERQGAEDYIERRNKSVGERSPARKARSGLSDTAGRTDQEIRANVVKKMFGSNWNLDRLVETPLHQVKMPAKIFVRNPELKKFQQYQGPMPGGNTPLPNINVFVREPWPAALVDRLPPTEPSPIAMSYIIRNQEQRGKFRPEEAERLGVPFGPLRTQLAGGKAVLSSDGVTVTPDMVLEPPSIGGGIAVVDLPSSDYVHAAINRPEWRSDIITEGIGAIIWLLGPGTIKNETLLKFMGTFPQIEHLVSSSDTCPNYLAMKSAASEAVRLNKIDPTRYPDLKYSDASPVDLKHALSVLGATAKLRPAQKGLKYQLEPRMELQTDDVVGLIDSASIVDEIPQRVLQLASKAAADIASAPIMDNQSLPSLDAEIICLGTGSAQPSNHRNVSSTLLRVPGSGSYLFDCGENTLGQLKRIYSPSELAAVLQDLKLIWISHLHADHHLGTTSVIKAWYEEVHGGKSPVLPPSERASNPADFLSRGRRLCLVSHPRMMKWLEEYSSAENFGYEHVVPLGTETWQQGIERNCTKLIWNNVDYGFNTTRSSPLKHAMTEATGLSNLVSCFVSHALGAQAVSLTFPNGFKVSYSGDCRPSKNFAMIGSGSTVLIHEATFDDEMKSDAEAKKHSTTSEAIGVGVAMGAKRIILTHFSQRYSKIPLMSDLDKSLHFEEDPKNDEDAEDTDLSMAAQAEANTPFNSRTEQLDPEVDDTTSKTTEPNGKGKPSDDIPESTSPSQSTNTPQNDIKIAVAFDYMRVRVKDIAHLEKFTPALQELYAAIEEPDGSRPSSRLSNNAETSQSKRSKAGQKPSKQERKEKDAERKAKRSSNQSPVRHDSISRKRKSQQTG